MLSVYIAPVTSGGIVLAGDGVGRYRHTLSSGSTYYYPLPDWPQLATLSAHVQWDASIILTSITIEDSNFALVDAPNHSSVAGDWIDEDPGTAFVGTVGAGASQSSGVVAVAGGAAGGCMFHVGGSGSARIRLKVVVAGTGGVVRVAAGGRS